MKNSLLMSQTALLLLLLLLGVRVGIAEYQTLTSPRSLVTNSTSQQNLSSATAPTVKQAPCQNTVSNITFLARLKVKAKRPCEGRLYIESPGFDAKPVCANSPIPEDWLSELCKVMSCGSFKSYKLFSASDAFELSSNFTLKTAKCQVLHIMCQEVPDTLGKELAAYKAVTGILIFLILGVILARFGRPMYKAIRKRFSQKQQNRWIGPTQSQSVSYHRGQGGPNNNTLKRQSYPGLERLTVSASREPSSNRNSDYDSYGFN